MTYVGIAALCALIGNIPLLIRRHFLPALIAGIAELIVGALIFYLETPTTVWPLFGAYGVVTGLVWWGIAAIVDGVLQDELTAMALFPAGYVTLLLGYFFAGSHFVRTSDYANLIGQVEERVWTQDIQPKDPKHMRMVSWRNAVYQAKKVLGTDGAIGSQFGLSTEHMTLQMVKGEMWYVAPLDFNSYSVWSSTKGVPAYVMINAEDPKREPLLKNLPEGRFMKYMPDAYLWDQLERYVRANGYLGRGLDNYNFEIDEEGNPWWVITVFVPTIVWNGEKTEGVLVVDPVTGSMQFHELGKIPGWVDRAVTHEYVKSYLALNGEYASGWWNSFWGKLNITKPEDPILIYSADGQPEFVTGITSHSYKDDSLVALVYTNSRTGKSVRYKVAGGATDSAVIKAINSNNNVQFKHLHAAVPQIYNVYGEMTCVASLMNDVDAFQGVAMVPLRNVQIVAVGEDQYSALREYEKLLAGSGSQIALGKDRVLEEIKGTVDRFSYAIVSSGRTYYFLHLAGAPHIFTGGAGELSDKLPLTQIGDQVRLSYYASEQGVVPMHAFDNISLPLTRSADEKAVKAAGDKRLAVEEMRQDSATVLERIRKLPPEKILELGKKAR